MDNCMYRLVTLQDLKAMTDAAAHRPVILVNPKLKVGFLWFLARTEISFLIITNHFPRFCDYVRVGFSNRIADIIAFVKLLGCTGFKWYHASKQLSIKSDYIIQHALLKLLFTIYADYGPGGKVSICRFV